MTLSACSLLETTCLNGHISRNALGRLGCLDLGSFRCFQQLRASVGCVSQGDELTLWLQGPSKVAWQLAATMNGDGLEVRWISVPVVLFQSLVVERARHVALLPLRCQGLHGAAEGSRELTALAGACGRLPVLATSDGQRRLTEPDGLGDVEQRTGMAAISKHD